MENHETIRSPSSTGARERFLAAGARVYAQNAAATLADVAQEAGVTKSMAHYYFANKVAFVRELYRSARASQSVNDAGLELTALSLSRQDPELKQLVVEAWAAERAQISAEAPVDALLAQAAAFGLALAVMIDPSLEAVAAQARLKLEMALRP